MRMAGAQHGVVTRAQLLDAGLSRDQVRHRVRRGVLQRLHPGVYRASAVTSPEERRSAALLACGAGASLSFRTAGGMFRLLAPDADLSVVDVTAPLSCRASRPGIRLHRTANLSGDEVTELFGMRVTTPARTILDLAGVLDERQLEQAYSTALRLDLATSPEIAALVARHPGVRGSGTLRALLAAVQDAAFVRSEAEARFLQIVRAAALQVPECNVRIQGFEVDFLWRTQRLIVEIDGFAFHASRAAFERDRRRDATLEAAGLRVLRFTWRQLTSEPIRVAAQVAQTLGRSYTG
jgi:very-short-patch-repair endonuclease